MDLLLWLGRASPGTPEGSAVNALTRPTAAPVNDFHQVQVEPGNVLLATTTTPGIPGTPFYVPGHDGVFYLCCYGDSTFHTQAFLTVLVPAPEIGPALLIVLC